LFAKWGEKMNSTRQLYDEIRREASHIEANMHQIPRLGWEDAESLRDENKSIRDKCVVKGCALVNAVAYGKYGWNQLQAKIKQYEEREFAKEQNFVHIDAPQARFSDKVVEFVVCDTCRMISSVFLII
jgi:hypothetical protein